MDAALLTACGVSKLRRMPLVQSSATRPAFSPRVVANEKDPITPKCFRPPRERPRILEHCRCSRPRMGGLDIDNALMYTPIKEDVNIVQPLGFDDGITNVCHLRRCRYGLKQSLDESNELLRDLLVAQGWRQLMHGPCIYIFEAYGFFAMIALYVDDVPVSCNTPWRVAFLPHVRSRYDIKGKSERSNIIGIRITRARAARITNSIMASTCASSSRSTT
jgi:hypothetical protein